MAPTVAQQRCDRFTDVHLDITTKLHALRSILSGCPATEAFLDRVDVMLKNTSRLVNPKTYSRTLEGDLYLDVCDLEKDLIACSRTQCAEVHEAVGSAYHVADSISDILEALTQRHIDTMIGKAS